ncbi:MAG: hypothetical protein JNM38_25865 [Acidobacteria bacterium]|nr:hypothetical protein [Acidobacteriota bacterium]
MSAVPGSTSNPVRLFARGDIGIVRAVLAAGNYAGWTGEQQQTFLGFNPTGGGSGRHP